MIGLGDRNVGSTIRFMFGTSSLAGIGIVRSVDGTVAIYKDGGTTQSTAGITDTDNFDGVAGQNLVVIDTSADGTFYSAGSDFDVVLTGATIDGQAGVVAVLAHFTLGMFKAVVDAIKAKTDNLPSDPADQSAVEAYVDARTDAIQAVVDAIQAKTDALPSDPADASVVAGLIAAVQAVVDAIKAKTDNLPSDPADASVVAGLIATAQAVLDSLTARIPAALHASGAMKSQVLGIVDETLQGDGTLGNEFRPV